MNNKIPEAKERQTEAINPSPSNAEDMNNSSGKMRSSRTYFRHNQSLMSKALIILGFSTLLAFAYGQTFEKQLLDTMMPKILLEEYENVPTADGYKFSYKTSDGSVREEVGVIMNPGTPEQEMVVMGSFGYEEGDTRTVTMYTADKNGYKPRVMLKNRKLNPKLLASLAG